MEKHLILHCAPTLAGIKTASLFSYTFSAPEELFTVVRSANNTLNPKGLYAEILQMRENFALLLVYRLSRLAADLARQDVQEFLAAYGYSTDTAGGCLAHLKDRFSSCNGFPHEVGIFLGYPLDDVIGFVENGGKNSKCTGYWKVYHNEYEAARLFAQYQKCRNIYARLFSEGRPLERLIVAV